MRCLALLFLTPLVAIAQPPKVDLDDWTPRPATGQVEPWETKRDPQWDDARFQKMDTGPFLNATFKYADAAGKAHMVYRGTAIKLGPDNTVLLDRGTGKVVGAWNGGLAISDKRFGLLNTPSPLGRARSIAPGVASTLPTVQFHGLYHTPPGVAWAYTENDQKHFATATGPDQKPFQVARTSDVGFTEEPAPPAPRFGAPIVTKLARGEAKGAFALDTLTIPYDNRFKALFFCTGVDFLPDGRVAVCTAHGDVWVVTVDETAGTCSWRRFAAGLYQPMGLKVVDGQVHVLERGQLTRLHDRNGDGEADFYENVCNQWNCGGGEHSYDTCLETDPAGNFYFHKTGDTHLSDGGCVMKIAKDGSKCEVFATGTRHPIGLGISPTGVVTGADQEGNWMPATRIDEYKKGGFYGDFRAHHRATPPLTYDPPLCWLPRETDNSAGGQVWVPENTFGPLAGLPLHFSYGRCKPFVLLRDTTHSVTQGGAWDLGVTFLSGVCRGRFHPTDGHLYVCGLNGWQTAAKADGCLQRLRYTGQPVHAVVGMKVVPDGVELTFSEPLDAASVAHLTGYKAAWWGYRWSKEYGSLRYKVSDPNAVGQDAVPVTAAALLPDGKTVRLTLAGMRPVMQLQVGVRLKTAAGGTVSGLTTMTVHATK